MHALLVRFGFVPENSGTHRRLETYAFAETKSSPATLRSDNPIDDSQDSGTDHFSCRMYCSQ